MLLRLYLGGKISNKRALGTLRVLAYGTVVSLGLGALTVRSAVADVNKDSLALGRKLAELQDLIQDQQQFRLNGESIFFSTGKTQESVATVLDRFEKHCNRSTAFDPLEWKELGAQKEAEINKKIEDSGMNRLGVLRTQDPRAHDGAVMCFTKDKTTAFLTGLENFTTSGDLHDLGDMRYVHAVQKADGRTYVQLMWTDGSFNIRRVMGEEGKDSVGSDFVNVPRPLHATRKLTAEAVGTPYSARIYESPDAPDTVLDTYIDAMHERGWVGVTSPDVSMEKNGLNGRYFLKPETAEQTVISVSKQDGKTMVVLAELGGVPKTDKLKVTAQ